jgi:dihydroorotate dehydrogenase A
MGLPNNGLDYYLDYVIERQRSGAKLQFLSVTGMSYEENIGLLKKIQESEYEGVTEFNLSCPNVPGKPQIAYDFELTDKLLSEVFTFFTKPIGVKLPPYFDIAHFDQMAKILNKYPLTYVNSVNSVGNGLYIDLDKEQVVIKPKGGFGGLGGEYIKPTALANVRAFRERLNPSIKIIGTGGVINGKDVFEHILCGADLVQVGTTLHKEGVSVFARLTKELQEVMKGKGYSSLDDFRGKLKVIE